MAPSRPSQSAFTLVDLMVALSIITIVLAFGVPGFRDLIANTKLTNAANSLIAHLHYARSEAIKRNTDISLCPSQDGATCSADGFTSWEGGYIVRIDAPNRVLRHVEGKEMAGLKVTKNNATKPIRYKADGAATGHACTLTICDASDSSRKRGVLVSDVGRPRVSDYAADGGALACP